MLTSVRITLTLYFNIITENINDNNSVFSKDDNGDRVSKFELLAGNLFRSQKLRNFVGFLWQYLADNETDNLIMTLKRLEVLTDGHHVMMW